MRVELQDLNLLVEIWKHLNAEGARPELAAALLRVINRLSAQNDSNGYTAWLELSRERVGQDIPYKLVCETRYGSRWDTTSRERRWAAEFSPAERRAAESLFRQSHRWHLSSGVPASVKMSSAIFDLWQKLGEFCASL